LEARAYEYFDRIDELGGMVEAVKRNFPQREIANAAFELQCAIDDGHRVVVGVNRFVEGDDEATPILHIAPELERKQIGRLELVRANRDATAVETALVELRKVAAFEGNLMPALIDAARAHATEGEIIDALQQVWGSYTERPVF
jgi:methylmalonyl-CoA mutase N-terminal domain/subunit